MFLTYFKVYIVQNSSGGSSKRLKSDDKRRYDFNNVTIIHANSHLSNSSIFPEILRACNDQKIILGIRKDSLGKKKDV